MDAAASVVDSWTLRLESDGEACQCIHIELPCHGPISTTSLRRFVLAATKAQAPKSLAFPPWYESGNVCWGHRGGFLARDMKGDTRYYYHDKDDIDVELNAAASEFKQYLLQHTIDTGGDDETDPDPDATVALFDQYLKQTTGDAEDTADLSNQGLGIRELRILLFLSELCPQMKVLNISHNSFAHDPSWDPVSAGGSLDEAWPPLRPIFSYLKELDLTDCSMDGIAAIRFFNHMKDTNHWNAPSALRTLRLSNNPIGDDAFRALRWFLSNLDGLYLSNCGITDKSMDLFVDYLDPEEEDIEMLNCKVIDLSNNRITANGVDLLCVSLSFVVTQDDGTTVTKSARLPNLDKLNLSGNPLGDQGIHHLAHRLAMRSRDDNEHRYNHEVRQLPNPLSLVNLSNTNCSTSGVCEFLEHVATMGVKEVSFANNSSITTADMPMLDRLDKALETALATKTLRKLDVSRGDIHSGACPIAADFAVDLLRGVRMPLEELKVREDYNGSVGLESLVLGCVDVTTGRERLEEELKLIQESLPDLCVDISF